MFIIVKNAKNNESIHPYWEVRNDMSYMQDENGCELLFSSSTSAKEYFTSIGYTKKEFEAEGIFTVEVEPVDFIQEKYRFFVNDKFFNKNLGDARRARMKVKFVGTPYTFYAMTTENIVRATMLFNDVAMNNLKCYNDMLVAHLEEVLADFGLISFESTKKCVCCGTKENLLTVSKFYDGVDAILCEACLITEAVGKGIINAYVETKYVDNSGSLVGTSDDVQAVVDYLKKHLDITDNAKSNADIRVADFDEEQSHYIQSSLIGENSITWGEIVEMQNKTAKDLWAEFNEVPTEDNAITVDWYAFPKGTAYREICDWFEHAFNVNMEKDLMG